MAQIVERTSVAEAPPLERAVALRTLLRYEWLAYLGLALVAVVTRFHDLGVRALHHDESLHALYSWYLYQGRGYIHDPMMHGPSLFEANALIYFLFGDTDVTARVVPALLGVAMVILPYFLRHELGQRGALAASVLFTISPVFLYFSRFIRHDIHVAVCSMLMVIGLWGYLRTREKKYVYTAATGLTLSFATKEDTYLTGFIFVTFLVGWAALQFIRTRHSDLVDAAAAIGWRSLFISLGIFVGVNAVLYTTFFTNLEGLKTGSYGALAYWIEQHGVERGSQPPYYYLILMPLYEFVPMFMAMGTTLLMFIWKRHKVTPFQWFTLYYAFMALVIYSWAGEKMPWLMVPITLPLILHAATFVEWISEGTRWRDLVSRSVLLPATCTLGALVAFAAWLGLGAAATLEPLDMQQVQLHRVALALVIAGLVAAVVYLGSRPGARGFKWPLLLAFGTAFGAFYVHTGWQVTYKNGDVPVDMLVYVQTSPDVPWVVRDLERLGNQLGQGKELKVYLDGGYTEVVGGQAVAHESIAWPFEWYLRDWKNKVYFSKTLPANTPTSEVPVILVMAPNVEPLRPVLRDYTGHKFRLNWWYPEDYKGLTLQGIWNGIRDPDLQAKLLRYILYRETLNPLGAREFYYYIRNDLVNTGARGLDLAAPTASPQAPVSRPPLVAQGLNNTTLIGRQPSGEGVLLDPKAIALDASGKLFVAEGAGSSVTIFTPEGSIATTFGRQGNGDGELSEPWGIAVNDRGEIFVADTWNHRIVKFDASGKFLAKWGTFADVKGQVDSNPGAFWGPRDMVIGPDGNLWVADTGNKRIQVFDQNGKLVKTVGGEGDAPGKFREPVGLAFDQEGNLYVADTWNKRIQKFDPDLQPVAQFPVEEWGSQSVTNKPYLTVDSKGRIYATIPDSGRLVVFAPDGSPLDPPAGPVLEQPHGLRMGPNDELYVVDSRQGIVVRYPAMP